MSVCRYLRVLAEGTSDEGARDNHGDSDSRVFTAALASSRALPGLRTTVYHISLWAAKAGIVLGAPA